MTTQRKRFIIGAIIALFLITAMTATWLVTNKNERLMTLPAEGVPIQVKEIWERVNQQFTTGTTEPFVLWKQEERVLYALDNQLYYTDGIAEPRRLYHWDSSLSAQAWVNGNIVLIGAQLQDVGTNPDRPIGAWTTIQLDDAPRVVDQSEQYIGPNEVLTVDYLDETALFLFTIQLEDIVRSLVYVPSIWKVLHNDLPEELGISNTVSKDNTVRHLTLSTEYSLSNGERMLVYDEDDGSIIYFKDSIDRVYRYDGYRLIDVKPVLFSDQSEWMQGQLRNKAGDRIMVLLRHNDYVLPYEERLWEGEWHGLDMYNYYQISPDAIKVIQYKEGYKLEDNELRFKQYPLDGARLIEQKGHLLEFEAGGTKKVMHVFDLVHTEAASLDAAWSTPLVDFRVKEEPNEYKMLEWDTHSIVKWSYTDYNTNAPIPDELFAAESEIYYASDYGFAKTYRKLDSQWYVLVEKELNEFDGKKLVKLGDVPVTVAVSIGEAAGGFGARDFIAAGDGWFIADTEGDRVLKLNNKLELVAELAVEKPHQLEMKADLLHIASLSNLVIADLSLQLVTVQPLSYTTASKTEMYEYFTPQQWYKDEQSGLTWYYLRGMLYQYNETKKQYRSMYIGEHRNYFAEARIFPYKDEIIAMLDHRLERFDRQGNWLSSIEYPRSEPDGIYDRSPQGENSTVFDKEKGIIYLVQGYRILGIDLENEQVDTVFRQNYAELGQLRLHENKLYVLLRNHIDDRYRFYSPNDELTAEEPFYSELVEINLETNQPVRSMTEGYFDRIEWDSNSSEEPVFIKLVRSGS